MTRAIVNLWGRQIGAVVWDESRQLGVFEYTPEFVGSGIEIAPLTMPLRSGVYDFPSLSRETFKGLPGMLADSLPDKFGNAVINRWLAEQGRTPESFNPVGRASTRCRSMARQTVSNSAISCSSESLRI